MAVSGCFDVLHGGHVGFLQRAREFGDRLVVFLGTEENIKHLKGAYPIRSDFERRELLLALECVDEVMFDDGLGALAFESCMYRFRPDVFIVNNDGHSEEKRKMVEFFGARYIVTKRDIPARSTTEQNDAVYPYRINLAGGWMDQPWVSSIRKGSVVNIGVWGSFGNRGGMATSTRRTMMQLYREGMPTSYERNAKMLFGADNPPHTDYMTRFSERKHGGRFVSGSQDAIGLIYPGVTRMDYDGRYWPENIQYSVKEEVLCWLEESISLRWLEGRNNDFDPLESWNPCESAIHRLGESGFKCWNAILDMDLARLQEAVAETYRAWGVMLPRTTEGVDLGGAFSMTGAGGGGYSIHIGDKPKDAVDFSIRREK